MCVLYQNPKYFTALTLKIFNATLLKMCCKVNLIGIAPGKSLQIEIQVRTLFVGYLLLFGKIKKMKFWFNTSY